MMVGTRTDVCLQGRLTVQLDGHVHHVATLHHTVRRRVGPSTGNIDSHRRAGPHDLIVIDRLNRCLSFLQYPLSESLS